MSISLARDPRDGGFTLVELLVVLTLLGVVGAIVGTSMTRGLRADAQARNRIEAFEDMQVAIERMSREIRAADPLQVADDDQIQVDVHRSGVCHRVTYKYDDGPNHIEATEERFDGACGSGTSLGSSTRVLLSDVVPTLTGAGAVFTYYTDSYHEEEDEEEGWQSASQPSETAFVEITVVRALELDQRPVTVNTVVGLRNPQEG